ncbi:electron transfer flavoprotein subunit alpha/FixB family protein [Bacillus mycoides]|nr:electron transfer flavoprotein subunit alpha/FixB family protein [Bacillus mycoides]
MGKEIVVIGDSQEYSGEHILQMLTKARSLGNQWGSRVSVLCVGKWDDGHIDTLFQYGADHIVICRQEGKFNRLYFTDIMAEMIKLINPSVLLVPATENGISTAASLSIRFEAGLVSDCVDIDFDEDGELYFSRANIHNSTISRIKGMNSSMILGTIKKDVFGKQECLRLGKGTAMEFTYNGGKEKPPNNWEVLETIKIEEKQEIDIHKYKKVFCIGRGVKKKETFERICRLAEKCGAGIVGTRASVEAGFIEKSRLVGQSGKRLSRSIYVGFGVSGASQHMIGVKDAKLIIAVNHEKNAPIFDYTDYAIVDNLEAVLDELEKITGA